MRSKKTHWRSSQVMKLIRRGQARRQTKASNVCRKLQEIANERMRKLERLDAQQKSDRKATYKVGWGGDKKPWRVPYRQSEAIFRNCRCTGIMRKPKTIINWGPRLTNYPNYSAPEPLPPAPRDNRRWALACHRIG